MAIQFNCDSCGEAFRLRDDAAGKQFKCKACGAKIRVPEAASYEEEFDDFLPPPPPVRARSGDRSGRRKRSSSSSNATLVPAIGLYVTGIIYCMYLVVESLISALAFSNGKVPDANPVGVGYGIFVYFLVRFLLFVITVVVLYGARCLQTRQSYGTAMTACVLASIPCCSPMVLFGIPFGIWGIIVLMNDDVKRSFD